MPASLQEDGVRERHALLSAFRRFLLGTKERSSGIVPGIECSSEGSSFFLETTVPSEVTNAVCPAP